MIFNKKKQNNIFLKFFWDLNSLYTFVIPFFKFIIFKNNKFKLNALVFRFIKLNLFQNEVKKLSIFFSETQNNKINENENFLKMEDKCGFIKFSNFSHSKKNTFFNKNLNNNFFSFFSTFTFLYSFTSFEYFSKHNHFFHFFQFKNYKKNFLTINLTKFVNRWKNAQNLIFTIYYYEFNPFVFGSFDYKNEIIALNWQNSIVDLKFWKYTCNFFIYKINKYGEKVFYFYNKLLEFDIKFFIISNVPYHYKNLYYFTRLKIFTLGLVSSNFYPWMLSYPIPSISSNNVIEYFFLKLLLFFYKNVLFFKYTIFKKNWISQSALLKTKLVALV